MGNFAAVPFVQILFFNIYILQGYTSLKYLGSSRVQECILSVSRGQNLSAQSIDRFCPEKPEMPTRIYFGMSPRPARINLISSLGGPCEDTLHCTLEKLNKLDLGFELLESSRRQVFLLT